MESQPLLENEVFDGIDYDDSADFEEEPILKKSKKEEIQWDEPKEYVLVCVYKKCDAYMKALIKLLSLDQQQYQQQQQHYQLYKQQ